MNEDNSPKTTQVRETTERDGAGTVTNRTVQQSTGAGAAVIVSRFAMYIGGIIVVLLVMRMILLIMAANQGNVFVDLVYGLSAVFAAPFYGIFNYQPVYGQSVFEVSSLVAIIVYGLVAFAVAKLATIGKK